MLRSHTPPDVPDVFRSVVSAELTVERDGSSSITAELVMFDGFPGHIRIGQFSLAGCPSWWSEWSASPFGACSLENGEWVRLDADMNTVLPLFQHRGTKRIQ